MATPYYDRTINSADAQATLQRLGATLDKSRSNGKRFVYVLRNKGEALVEPAGSGLRVRLYAGACPCK